MRKEDVDRRKDKIKERNNRRSRGEGGERGKEELGNAGIKDV